MLCNLWRGMCMGRSEYDILQWQSGMTGYGFCKDRAEGAPCLTGYQQHRRRTFAQSYDPDGKRVQHTCYRYLWGTCQRKDFRCDISFRGTGHENSIDIGGNGVACCHH